MHDDVKPHALCHLTIAYSTHDFAITYLFLPMNQLSQEQADALAR